MRALCFATEANRSTVIWLGAVVTNRQFEHKSRNNNFWSTSHSSEADRTSNCQTGSVLRIWSSCPAFRRHPQCAPRGGGMWPPLRRHERRRNS